MDRDKEILEFINKFQAATLSQIRKVFFKDLSQGEVIARRRMKKITDAGLIIRERSTLNTEYIYCNKKSNQLQHKLILTEFYTSLLELPGKIKEFEVNQIYEKVRPDGVLKYIYGNSLLYFFVEVHISNNKFNQKKYEDLYVSRKYKQYFEVFPRVIIITDKKVNIQDTKLKFIFIPTSCQDIGKILI